MSRADSTAAPPPTQRDDRAPSRGTLPAFWRFARSYWTGGSRWEATGLTVAALAASLCQVLLQLRLNRWLGEFFDALESHDRPRLLEQAIAFAVIVIAIMAAGAWQIGARMAWQASLRRWLTTRLIDRWLESGRHYLLPIHAPQAADPDYRIAEDARLVTEASIDFAIGLFNSVLALAGFIGVLWSLSSLVRIPLAGGELAVPGYLVIIALVYSGCGSVLTYLVGRPMIAINEARHAREGDFRLQLLRVNDNSEGIAFLHGEADERRGLDRVFGDLLSSWRGLIGRQRRLALVTIGYTTMVPVVPLLAAMPSFLSGEISLGGMVQASAAFVQIQLALGFVVDNFARLSDWRAGTNRMQAMIAALDDIDRRFGVVGNGSIAVTESADRVLRFVDVHLDGPDGVAVIDQATAEIQPGERVLVVGESGAGKTTLVRAAAGLWPWGSGRIELPRAARIAFMPERPYFPAGTLRAALAYPDPPGSRDDEALRAALHRCGLPALASRLDDEERWGQLLSVGEQQMLGFARLLVHRVDCVFMDEATTALDDAALDNAMSLFKTELAGTTLISVDHRPGLDAYHDRTMALRLSPRGGRLTPEIDGVVAPRSPRLRERLRRLLSRYRG